jgi:hypothetical protein
VEVWDENVQPRMRYSARLERQILVMCLDQHT